VEERKLQYQYNSGELYHFMDQENFEEVAIAAETSVINQNSSR